MGQGLDGGLAQGAVRATVRDQLREGQDAAGASFTGLGITNAGAGNSSMSIGGRLFEADKVSLGRLGRDAR